MSGTPRDLPWTLGLSVLIYRRLLVAYPPAFRHEYGAQMVQVFRDCCRETSYRGGVVELGRFWLLACGDLIVSALAERRQEEWHMTRTHWIRLGSLAAIVGGAVATLFVGLDLIIAIAQLLDEKSLVGLTLFPVHIVSWASPTLILFYILALLGLQARGADRMGAVGWIAITTAILGMLLTELGNGLTSVVMYSQANGCRTPLDCNFYDPNHYMKMGYLVGLLGSMVFMVGMIAYGIAALRRRILPRQNWLPLVVGMMPLLNLAASIVALLVSPGTDYAGDQKVMIMLDTVTLAFAIVWILLGLAMRPRGDSDLPAQAVTVEPAE